MSSGYQGYGGGGGYSGSSGGGWGAPQQHQQQRQPPMYSSNQFGQPQQGQQQQQQQQQPGNMNQWQYPQQQPQQQQPGGSGFGFGHSSGGGYGGQQQQSTGGAGMYGQPPQQLQQPSLFTPQLQQAAMGAFASMATGQGVPGDMLKTEADKFFQSSIFPGFHTFMISLRSYFAVDNRYVLAKMKRVLFPFLSKYWKRNLKSHVGSDSSTSATYDLPIADENAPDLYIPSMSLITYVLLSALCYGNAGQFNPEVIPDVCMKCFLANLLEVFCIWVGFYMMRTSVPLLDLLSYTGYKYLGLCMNMFVGLLGRMFGLGGATAFYVCFVWTSLASAYLMLKIMSHTVPMQVAADGPRRDVMVLAFAAAQPVFMWFVSNTKFL